MAAACVPGASRGGIRGPALGLRKQRFSQVLGLNSRPCGATWLSWLIRFAHLASLDEIPGLPVFDHVFDIVHNRYDAKTTQAFLD